MDIHDFSSMVSRMIVKYKQSNGKVPKNLYISSRYLNQVIIPSIGGKPREVRGLKVHEVTNLDREMMVSE